MNVLKDKKFWIGVAVGMFVMPMVLNKVAPAAKAKLPSGG
jgi:hypothetical protein